MLQGRSSKNQIFVQTYDAQSSVVQDFTNDPDLLNEKIQELKAGGGKALYDAIFSACREKMMKAGNPEENRRVLVVISDGLDVQSTHTIEEAISMARRAETLIYTIGNAAYGYTNTGDVNLVKMADATGGAPFFPLRTSPGADMGTGYISHGTIGETSQNKGLGAETGTYSAQRGIQLADALEAISRQLNEQYNLGYTPARTALDGTYRTIRVESTHRNMTMRWKPGYFAAVE
jgi:VWFA-related protein